MGVFVSSFTQGVSVKAEVDLPKYQAPTWTLKLVLVRSDAQQIISASASGAKHLLALTTTQSAAFDPGTWDYQAFVTDGTDRHMIETGTVEVHPDFETQTGGIDTRTAIDVQIDAIEAQLAGTATTKQKRVKYGDREVEQHAPAELIEALNYLRLERRRQERKNRDPRIRVRFR